MFGPLLSLDESFRCSTSVSLVVDHHYPCRLGPCPLGRQVEIPHCDESHSGLSLMYSATLIANVFLGRPGRPRESWVK